MLPSSPTLDDVFSGDKCPDDVIVDADVIESVKENIQPLQGGRRATALSALFSTPHSQRDTILSQRRARFRLQITRALEDTDYCEEEVDALDIYSRFVAWTLESYPQGQSVESGLVELLEEATRKLKDCARYKKDPRYLKLWTQYAGYVENPVIIYSYLFANEIATNLAQLYEEYAYVLERDGRRREADEMYQIGIARKAEPLDHLKQRHADFQRRIILSPLPPPSSPPRVTEPAVVGRRVVLGETLSQPRRALVPPASDVFTAPQRNARLQVFCDPTGEAARNADGNGWPDIGTRVSRTKENRPEVRKMGDGPLSKSRATQRSVNGPASRFGLVAEPPVRRSFVPFRDEDDDTPPPVALDREALVTPQLEPPRDTGRFKTPRPALTPHKDEAAVETASCMAMGSIPMSIPPRVKINRVTSEAEALRKDPFKNYSVRPDNT